MKGPLKPGIVHVGQHYVDEPIHANPKKESTLTRTILDLFDAQRRQPRPIVIAYRRVKLKWIKPRNTTTA